MTSPGWPEIVARLHDTLVRCDRDTDLELAAGARRLHLTVRRATVRGTCPPHDARQLADLGWQAAPDGGAFWYETPRTPEALHWWSGFACRTAAAVLTADTAALTCRVLPAGATATDPGAATSVAGHHASDATPDGGDTVLDSGDTVPDGGGVDRTAGGADRTAGGADRTAGGRHRADDEPGPDPGPPAGRTATVDATGLLADAAARHDLRGYLGVLLTGGVCVPLADEPTPEREFPWTVVLGAGGEPLLPVFTSPETLVAFVGPGVPFVATPATDLLADWPDRSWGLTVDPGAPHGLTLSAPALGALLAANDVAGLAASDGAPVPAGTASGSGAAAHPPEPSGQGR
ncbi:SseB family protein [Micromonospora coxensis]|uniref:SseB protein N-terminal domain-containing protein n=1 Tax=Micromonospora coxensis TaxID=356852 RepID=A0A1C5JXD4_9ACTN|nr:SseB family protein [Micromonospora coxensis]SCG75242.1 SseB protein N-terminal domain-containing protein [Micromonospora coxensis]